MYQTNLMYVKPGQDQHVLLQLTGPETRPEILIAAPGSSLGTEQAEGLTEDQALQYSSYIYHGTEE
jgi:hypothetical protein